ncbi:MAG TPA: bifunctional serine/threonine-protein kinase/formylglycine-generating enzyme family protein [Rudaea sp.]|jgi:formylglycine-generating enzyme required for sulfatase activity|nr:bifunctional serine/threonine-protein kinase/formylglycine-generating enzyme family protein [Rudaea sp.]
MNDAKSDPLPHIAGYDISRRLGRGGMADVYLAMQASLSRPVAIKVLAVERTSAETSDAQGRPQGEDFEETVARFEREARTIARLDHPHIVSIFDVGRTDDGKLYYVMPYLPNGDLSTRDLREDETAIVAVVRALCRALGYAHTLGVVHRDVKPENVLFDKLDRPLLADFGIALATHQSARVTREGSTMGSSGYMSPEQARGHSIDGRADLYSLGVVAYEMLCGDLPFHGPDALAVALAHVEQPVPRLRSARRHWQEFIDRAMAKSPAERFQTAAQMEAALDTIAAQLGDAPAAAYATKPMAAVHAPQRETRAYAGIVAAVVLGLGGAVLIGYGLTRLRQSQEAAGPGPAASATSQAGTAATILPATAETPASTDATASEQPARAEAAGASAQPATAPQAAAADNSGAARPEPPPAPRLGDLAPGTRLRDRGGPELAFVPAIFSRGGQRQDIGHPFALARYEITRGEYAAFARATGRDAAKCREPRSPLSVLRKLSWREPGFEQNDSHPAVCVSWADANAYAQWLGTRLHARYRLPSRAEWLHATRWSVASPGICAQGDLADDKRALFGRGQATGCSDGFAFTAPVGQFKPNQIGIHDLVGNVSEWMRDCKSAARTGKNDDGPCPERLFSGSSWRDSATDQRVDVVDDAGVDVGYTTIGFRVLREFDGDKIPPIVK